MVRVVNHVSIRRHQCLQLLVVGGNGKATFNDSQFIHRVDRVRIVVLDHADGQSQAKSLGPELVRVPSQIPIIDESLYH